VISKDRTQIGYVNFSPISDLGISTIQNLGLAQEQQTFPKDNFLTFVKIFTNHNSPSSPPFPFLIIANFMENLPRKHIMACKTFLGLWKNFQGRTLCTFSNEKNFQNLYTHTKTIKWAVM